MDLENRKFVFLILKIILLTNIPAIVMLIPDFKNSIGWITGSLASGVNFWFMSQKTSGLDPGSGKKSIVVIMSKAFVLRYAFLAVWSVFVILVIKPNMIAYCLGLFAAQFSLVIYHVYILCTTGTLRKYFVGEEDTSESNSRGGGNGEKEEET